MIRPNHEPTPDTTSPILTNGQTPGEQYQDAAGEWRYLSPKHLRDLEARRITLDTAKAARLYSVDDPQKLNRLLDMKIAKRGSTALVFPFPPFDEGYCRVRPDIPFNIGGNSAKYVSPKGRRDGLRPYFPPGVLDSLQNPEQEVIVTEGEFKSLLLTQENFPCIGLIGVDGWRTSGRERLAERLAIIPWNGRRVFIAFDSDIDQKPQVADAESRLALMLEHAGAVVRCVRIPGDKPQ